jgi:hypothetical protein
MAQKKDEDLETRNAATSSEESEPGRDPDKPMTDTQRTYLEPLAESQDAKVRDDMSEAEASRTIDRLQENAVHVY